MHNECSSALLLKFYERWNISNLVAPFRFHICVFWIMSYGTEKLATFHQNFHSIEGRASIFLPNASVWACLPKLKLCALLAECTQMHSHMHSLAHSVGAWICAKNRLNEIWPGGVAKGRRQLLAHIRRHMCVQVPRCTQIAKKTLSQPPFLFTVDARLSLWICQVCATHTIHFLTNPPTRPPLFLSHDSEKSFRLLLRLAFDFKDLSCFP